MRIGTDDDDACAVGRQGASQRSLQGSNAISMFRERAQARGVRGKIDCGRCAAVCQQVVERFAAGGALQSIDAPKATVVQQHDGHLHAKHHRGRAISELSMR